MDEFPVFLILLLCLELVSGQGDDACLLVKPQREPAFAFADLAAQEQAIPAWPSMEEIDRAFDNDPDEIAERHSITR